MAISKKPQENLGNKEPLKFREYKMDLGGIREDVLIGLQKPDKELPSKLLYDERGSDLFEQITKLEEYYPTRTEISITVESIQEIVSILGQGTLLIEYGCGSSDKIKTLLDFLPEPAAYVPIDISKEHLVRLSHDIAERYEDLEVLPVCTDYSQPFKIPSPSKRVVRKIVYYPGSTIGNFKPEEAVTFLRGIADVIGIGGGLLLGVDLKKDPKILNSAYNDSQGVTAEFNLNLLKRLNRELGTNFNIDQFRHQAIYNESEGRVEMHLISKEKQSVHLNGVVIPFRKDESIRTEVSYKYTFEEFEEVAWKAGFEVHKVWTDTKKLFSVQYLTISPKEGM